MQGFNLLALQLVVIAVQLFGLFGLLTTIVPGLVIIWLAVLAYWLATGFSTGTWVVFTLITILMVAGSLADNFIVGAKVRQTGAPWYAIGVAMLAGLAGSIVLPPFGGLVTGPLALYVVEWLRMRSWREALWATRSMVAGCGWAVLLRFGIGILMILLWAGWVFIAQ